VFRLSLRDSWALQVMIDAAARADRQRIGLLLPNTEWGRSSQRAAQAVVQARSAVQLAGVQWYNWGEASMLEKYQALRVAGADAIILVANDREGALLVREVAALPAEQRLPIFSHWGITGGTFFENTGAAVLAAVDFSVVQTYSFLDARDPVALHVIAAIRQRGIDVPRRIEAPVGVAQAYDLVWILARAIDRAGSIERAAVRDALEQVNDYRGLIRYYARPFAPDRHEALALEDVFMARYAADGAIERIGTVLH
ncbi:MAG TPA: ABC transporter substrate-binding protein, partial [Candidatus Competibacteraceae bacterium]|nr:ABC transporter substrate-binding protein [Candidatus Competibacteraceae bacterium]